MQRLAGGLRMMIGAGLTLSLPVIGYADEAVQTLHAKDFQRFETPYIVRTVDFSPDGKLLAACGSVSKTLDIWDVTTGKKFKQIKAVQESDVYSVAFSPDGKSLVCGNNDATARIFNVATGNETHRITDHRGAVRAVTYAPQGDNFATAGTDGTVRLWTWKKGDYTNTAIVPDFACFIQNLTFSPDGSLLAFATKDIDVRIWNVSRKRDFCSLPIEGRQITSVVFSPNGQRISVAIDNMVQVWSLSTRRLILEIRTQRPAMAIAFNATGKLLVVASGNGFLDAYTIDHGKRTASLQGHTRTIYSLRLLPAKNTIASCSWNPSVVLWQLDRLSRVAGSNPQKE